VTSAPATASAAPRTRIQPTKGGVGDRFVPWTGIIVSLVIGVLLAAFLLYSLWAFWPTGTASARPRVSVTYLGIHFRVSTDVLLFLVVACAGALGGTIHTLRSLSWYAGNRQLKWSWMPFYALLPLVAGSLATVFYLVIRAGLFSPSTTTQQVSPYGFAALAALVGLFSEQAMQKLRDVSSTLLSPAPQGSDHVDDPDNAPAPSDGQDGQDTS
jgi:hypothetical protein